MSKTKAAVVTLSSEQQAREKERKDNYERLLDRSDRDRYPMAPFRPEQPLANRWINTITTDKDLVKEMGRKLRYLTWDAWDFTS